MTAQPLVLLVDDDPLVRTTLALSLRRHGFATLEAGDAEEALRLCASARPAIALVDLRLPGLPGTELIRLLREASGMPCALLTGMDDPAAMAAAHAAGATVCLGKPIDPAALHRLLRTILESAGREDTRTPSG